MSDTGTCYVTWYSGGSDEGSHGLGSMLMELASRSAQWSRNRLSWKSSWLGGLPSKVMPGRRASRSWKSTWFLSWKAARRLDNVSTFCMDFPRVLRNHRYWGLST